jgi:hypothetical protein
MSELIDSGVELEGGKRLGPGGPRKEEDERMDVHARTDRDMGKEN